MWLQGAAIQRARDRGCSGSRAGCPWVELSVRVLTEMSAPGGSSPSGGLELRWSREVFAQRGAGDLRAAEKAAAARPMSNSRAIAARASSSYSSRLECDPPFEDVCRPSNELAPGVTKVRFRSCQWPSSSPRAIRTEPAGEIRGRQYREIARPWGFLVAACGEIPWPRLRVADPGRGGITNRRRVGFNMID